MAGFFLICLKKFLNLHGSISDIMRYARDLLQVPRVLSSNILQTAQSYEYAVGLISLCARHFSSRLPPTRSKIHSRIKALKRSATQEGLNCTICCEEHHFIPQMVPEEILQVSEVIIIASEVTAVLIFNLKKFKHIKLNYKKFAPSRVFFFFVRTP